MSESAGRYGKLVLEHFRRPRNVGEIPDADGIGRVEDPSCGDFLQVWIKVGEDQRLTNVKFLCKGCPAAIACGSVMTELAIGKTLDEASEITDEVVEEALGGLPEQKRHCSNLAADALYGAILDHIVRTCERARLRAPMNAQEGAD